MGSYLPHDFPPVFTVHSFYRRAHLDGLRDSILSHLIKKRQIVTDDMGSLLSVVVHKSNLHDTKLCLRSVQVLWFESRNIQEIKAARLASIAKKVESGENVCLTQPLSPTFKRLRADCCFC